MALAETVIIKTSSESTMRLTQLISKCFFIVSSFFDRNSVQKYEKNDDFTMIEVIKR